MVQPFSAPVRYHVGGPLHSLLSRLITIENLEGLGFVSVEEASTLVEKAFVHHDPAAMRAAIVLGQWIVLSREFNIPRAMPEAEVHTLFAKVGLEMYARKLGQWTSAFRALGRAMRCAHKYVRLMY